MPVETITIINNTGKIISTGKHLVNIFKEAKAAYNDRKDNVQLERAAIRADYDAYEAHERRQPPDLERGWVSSQRSQTSHSHAQKRPPLTASNLRTHSEVSTRSSQTPTYRSPYAETLPTGTRLSRPTLVHSTSMPITQSGRNPHGPTIVPSPSEMASAVVRQGMLVQYPRSEPCLRSKKEVDMNLAYGNMPPDLATRVDLDPCYKGSAQQHEDEAMKLMGRVETVLTEAQCLHHSATATIAHLQRDPDAAAAVALTLAELSTLLGKMSPAFLAIVKGGSPAVFALLASPQFLIGTSIAVGVTVVMFGGWKIVKRICEAAHKEREAPLVALRQPYMYTETVYDAVLPDASQSYDEALVLDEDLTSIESWRRGIVPMDENDMADIELMSLEAQRTLRERHGRSHRSHAMNPGHRYDDGIDPSDSASRVSSSTHTRKSHRRHRSSRSLGGEPVAPDRKGSRSLEGASKFPSGDGGSQRSHASRSKKSEWVSVRTIEDADKNATKTHETVLRPKAKKPNLLKALFKKRMDDEDGKDRVRRAVSVMV